MVVQGLGCSLGALVGACKLSVVAGTRDPVPQPGIEPWPPALGTWSPIPCTTREVPEPF